MKQRIYLLRTETYSKAETADSARILTKIDWHSSHSLTFNTYLGILLISYRTAYVLFTDISMFTLVLDVRFHPLSTDDTPLGIRIRINIDVGLGEFLPRPKPLNTLDLSPAVEPCGV